MSTPNRPLLIAIQSHQDRLREVCPMSVRHWRVAKAVLYSLILASIALQVLAEDANPTVIGGITLVGILTILVGEVKEIEVANLATVTFKNGHGDGQGDDDES